MYIMSQFASLSKYEILRAYSSTLDPLLQGDSLQIQPLPFCSLPSCARLTKDTSCVASIGDQQGKIKNTRLQDVFDDGK